MKIGIKLGILGGVGALLVSGMVVSQMMTNANVAKANASVNAQQMTADQAGHAKEAVRGMRLANRDIRLAHDEASVFAQFDILSGYADQANQNMEAAAARAVDPANRDRMLKAVVLTKDYVSHVKAIGAAQIAILATTAARDQSAVAWEVALKKVHALPVIDSPSSLSIMLDEANIEFNDARRASWRYFATQQRDNLTETNTHITNTAAKLRRLAEAAIDEQATKEIAHLQQAATDYKKAIDSAASHMDSMDIHASQADSVGADLESLTDKIAETAKSIATERAAEAGHVIDRAAMIGLIIGLAVIAVLLGSAIFSYAGIARPLVRLNGAMTQMANGHLDIVIPGAQRRDEIGDIAKTIVVIRQNAEQEALAKQAAIQEQETQRAQQRKAEMHQLADAFEAAVGNIVATVSQAANHMESAATSLSQTAEQTQQLSQRAASGSEEASTNVQTVASATEEMASSVREINRQVEESSRISGEAVEQAKRADSRIALLSRAADRIGDVTKLITSIAEQTNLLALNATIEAARAGEAGKGFAVVAQEVKTLAAQTAKATDEIDIQIREMQSATLDSVEAIKDINETISNISSIAAAITVAVEEQGAATNEIARNVQGAARGTSEVTANVSEVSRGASETGSAAAQVLSSAQSLSLESAHLKQEMENFLGRIRAA